MTPTGERAQRAARAWSFYLVFVGPCISILGLAGPGEVVVASGSAWRSSGCCRALVFAVRDSRRRRMPVLCSLRQGLRRGFSFIDLF